MKKILMRILQELKQITKKLPAIESSKESEKLFTFPKKGSIKLYHNHIVEEKWINDEGVACKYVDISNATSDII